MINVRKEYGSAQIRSVTIPRIFLNEFPIKEELLKRNIYLSNVETYSFAIGDRSGNPRKYIIQGRTTNPH
jgi:hypothetical protein